MTPVPPVVRYRVQLLPPKHGGNGREVLIAAEDVVAWVAGFGAAVGVLDALDVIDERDPDDPRPVPEDTRRVQALQIGDSRGWFRYLYPETTSAEAQ